MSIIYALVFLVFWLIVGGAVILGTIMLAGLLPAWLLKLLGVIVIVGLFSLGLATPGVGLRR